MGNVDTAACSNSVVDACIFPLDHQALQDFSNHQHMSSVKNPEKNKISRHVPANLWLSELFSGFKQRVTTSWQQTRFSNLNGLNGKTQSSLQGDASEISGQSSPGV